jgi:hypothetical protein
MVARLSSPSSSPSPPESKLSLLSFICSCTALSIHLSLFSPHYHSSPVSTHHSPHYLPFPSSPLSNCGFLNCTSRNLLFI